MKRSLSILQKLLWIFMIIILVGVITAGVATNITIRSIEKKLPGTLLTELNDLSLVLENLSDVVRASQTAKDIPNENNISILRQNVETVYKDTIRVRESYVLDNLIQASAFHAVVAPAIADLQIWLSSGVSGFAPDTKTTLNIAYVRIKNAYQKARRLTRGSRQRAQTILDEQRKRLDRFLLSANLLFALTILITFSIVYLLIRQYSLQQRESATQSELRNQRDLLNSLFENVLLGITLWDQEGILLFSNKSFTKITGYSMLDIASLEDWFPKAYPDEKYRNTVLADWSASSGQNEAVREFKVTCKSGEVKDIEFRGTFLRDGRALVTMWDITEKKQAENILKENQKIKARSKKMESLGLLAGGVAHDLNNILSGIVSYPELILLDLPESSDLRKPIETIQESGHRAAAIVQDLLTVARGVAIVKEPLNLNSIVKKYLLSPEYKKLKQFHSNIIIKTELDAELFNVKGSQVHIRKALMNLVSNAAEAAEKGGRVLISTMNRYLDKPVKGYSGAKMGEHAILAVFDDGPGITPSDLERIFEPFYTKKMMGRSGTGLGLAVVWNVMQDHEGYIDVTSNESGSTFELYFPITREAPPGEDVSRPIKDYKGCGETILIVDDVKSQREITSTIMEKLGYKVKTVSSGEEAVEYVKEQSVNLIILDMIMDPGISGSETYKRILTIRPDQKAIIVSGFANTEEVRETQKLGAAQFIKKPFTLEKIGIAVKEELARQSFTI